ncbi:MAG TPA: hypothetical protein VF642_04560 [Propionibacteriaceae bacterium]
MLFSLLMLLPLDAAGKPGLLLLALPVLVVFAIFWGVYLARQRSRPSKGGDPLKPPGA